MLPKAPLATTSLWGLLAALSLLRTRQGLADVSASAPRPVITIPLDKQSVPVVRNGVTVAHKTAYFGKVFLGLPSPQAFTVVFDTGSGHFFLPSSACRSEVCAAHRRYDRAASGTAVDINHDGKEVGAADQERDEVAVVYGTGEINGEFVREVVCFSEHTGAQSLANLQGDADCTTVRVVLASQMTQEPFSSFGFDGVIGLGLDSLSLDAEFSFFGQVAKSHNFAEARFGYFLAQNDLVRSEISFGGHDPRRVASELRWAPVHRPELGYWQVKLQGVTVGGVPVEACKAGGCTAIADTGTSLLGVPKEALRGLHVQLARKVPGDPDELDCRRFPGPDLVFDMGNGILLELGPEDYSRPAAMKVVAAGSNTSQVICRASLMPVESDPLLGGGAWILGEPVLRKYYTAYDWHARQVGFALAAQPPAPEGDGQDAPAHPEAPIRPAVVHV